MAAAIARRYGLAEAAIAQRMATGRFRVKSNVDLTTARTFCADLERLGAVCSVVDAASGQTIAADAGSAPTVNVPAGAPPPGPMTPPGAFPAAAPPPEDTSPLAGAAPGTGAAPDASPLAGAAPGQRAPTEDSTGLAAASADEGRSSQQDLGALAAADGLSLASLDGEEEEPEPSPEESAFAPDDAAFAPPEQTPERELSLAVDVRDRTPPPGPVAPPPGAEPSPAEAPPPSTSLPTQPGPRASSAMAGRSSGPADHGAVDRARRALAEDARIRWVAGVLVALLLGFLPAHLLASMRENDAYSQIRKEVRTEYGRVTNVDQWRALDEYLVGQRDIMDARRQNIAITAILVWALVGGGIAFAWFRVIDWDRVAPD